MKIIVLIIASDTYYYNNMKEVWKTYMNIHPNFKTFFICNNPDISEDIIVEEKTIYVKDYESYIPGILNKTISSFEYCLNNFEFDYIYRTNLSSFIDFYKAYNYLEKNQFDYGGCGIGFDEQTYFASGCGFILSKKGIKTLLDNKNLLNYNIFDDVAIGELLTRYYCITSLPREDIEDINDKRLYNDENTFHYRCKCNFFDNTIIIFNKLKDKIYKK
jgi:hypothetical protein